jgi:hypothetical protein
MRETIFQNSFIVGIELQKRLSKDYFEVSENRDHDKSNVKKDKKECIFSVEGEFAERDENDV